MTTALLLAALAVAYLLWSRPAAPAGLPPLSPLPAPRVPPAAPATGPHPLTLLAILAAGGMVAFAILESGKPAPAPAPVVDGIDLRGKFVGQHAAEDAATVAVLTLQTAEAVHDDGKIDFDGDGRIDEPRLLTGRQIWELRNLMRAYLTGGVLLGERQPMVRDEIKRYLDERCGKSSGELTPEQKAAWEDAFRVINKAAVEAVQ